MGRVARYKKVKSFDPFSKKNGGRGVNSLETVGVWGLSDNGRRTKKRSRTAEALHQKKVKRRRANHNDDDDYGDDGAFDLPPSSKEDDFDLADMVGSIKKETIPSILIDPSTRPLGRTVQVSEGLHATIPQTEQEEKKVAKLLNIKPENYVVNKKGPQAPAGKMEGESKRAYHKRVKSETRQIIRREHIESNNPEKRKRKNEFLAERKKKKKKSNTANFANDDSRRPNSSSVGSGSRNNDSNDGSITGERAAAAAATTAQDHVRFGEQAQRPPEFRHLPRGAKKPTTAAAGAKTSSKTKPLNEQQIAAEKNAMENLRRKVQAQYAVIKMKRKQAGDFHL